MRITDVNDAILSELRSIREAVSDDPQPAHEHPTGTYYSSGPDPIEVAEQAPDDEYRDFRFGFAAGSVMVRTDQTLHIAFTSPYKNGDHVLIRVEPQDSPFVMGGDNPIRTSQVWLRRAPESNANANVQVQAIPK